ncbi:hypothetical protein ACFSCX_11925 [Bacillus salitolerans]|uniref:Lipoprotein n=1 Tax=Bacillus salitolerans TaxID=1437434 RepID=A0ABW4LS12_9BACI
MKKLLVAGILSSSLFLAACAAEDNTADQPDAAKEADVKEETPVVDTKASLVNFHLTIIDNFKDEYQTYLAYNAAVAAYDAAVASQTDAEVAEEDKPTAEDLAELQTAIDEAKAAAQGIAAASAEEIRTYAVPSELEAYEADITAALDELAKFYEALEANIDDAETANAHFTAFEEKMGAIFVGEDLPAPSYANAMK